MIRFSIKLPKKYRLELSLAKRRGEALGPSILPPVRDILNIRRGSKLSRVFAHIFSHKHIKKILGANIAFAIIVAGNVHATKPFTEAELNIVVAENLMTRTEKGTQYPTPNTKINQGYKFFHPGIDFEGDTGDPVKPVMGGKVQNVQYSRFAYGNAVIVDHGSGLTSLYAHLSKIEVAEGQDVNKNSEIGKVGSTGRSTGDHLHLEVRQNGIPVNPLTVLPKDK